MVEMLRGEEVPTEDEMLAYGEWPCTPEELKALWGRVKGDKALGELGCKKTVFNLLLTCF